MESFLIDQINSFDGPFKSTEIKKVSAVSGGCIHNAWQLELKNGKNLFAKTCEIKNSAMLKFEANGLENMSKYVDPKLLLLPKPIAFQELKTHAILLLPWLNFSNKSEVSLGKGLASLHKKSSEEFKGGFGWGEEGFIGLGYQPKGWEKDWAECFVNLRLIPQIQTAKKWGLKLEELSNFLSKIKTFLKSHKPSPSLVHGDLWQGNAGTDAIGRGIIFDPAIWWADREVDLAMTKLFGSFSEEFYSGYQQVWALPKMWEERVDIYNLYHLINHANIFGGSYKEQTVKNIKKINASISN